PRTAGRSISAATFVSQKFPSRGYPETIIRCFLGGAGKEDLIGEDDRSLAKRVLTDLRDLAGIEAEPRFVKIYRWNKANPQYNVGHVARLQKIEHQIKAFPGIYLAGASFYGVGIPDCIRSGEEAAERCFTFIKTD
ncbi:MAG: FAD-dependent oxidoreductase, partial [Elusimicrobia bacterium]|nr:FAD-dependent oxidoreductase [Elusimicrobiota bacterium]